MSLQLTYILFLFLFLFSLFVPSSLSAFLTPIAIDPSTHQYSVIVSLNTPPQPTKLLLDLDSPFPFLPCNQSPPNSSPTYLPIPCNSSLCSSLAGPAAPICANRSCAILSGYSLTQPVTAVNSLGLPITNGRNPGRPTLLPEFVFSCSEPALLRSLAKETAGLAGFSRSNFSLPAQFWTAFSLPHSFALCLSGSPSSPGVAFLGSRGPYNFLPQIDLSQKLIYTPLLNPPRPQPSDEYFIGLRSIKVNGKAIDLKETLLTVDQDDFGGTKISTVVPYTVLQASIYKSFTEAFVRESAAMNLTVTKPVKPFGVCYPAADVSHTRLGPAVPTVDLVMESEDVFWRVFGSNSMVRISRKDADVWCLGFLNGGAHPRASIAIGGHQMENNLLQFDLERNRVGFSSSMLAYSTTCANFNFTTIISL